MQPRGREAANVKGCHEDNALQWRVTHWDEDFIWRRTFLLVMHHTDSDELFFYYIFKTWLHSDFIQSGTQLTHPKAQGCLTALRKVSQPQSTFAINHPPIPKVQQEKAAPSLAQCAYIVIMA